MVAKEMVAAIIMIVVEIIPIVMEGIATHTITVLMLVLPPLHLQQRPPLISSWNLFHAGFNSKGFVCLGQY